MTNNSNFSNTSSKWPYPSLKVDMVGGAEEWPLLWGYAHYRFGSTRKIGYVKLHS